MKIDISVTQQNIDESRPLTKCACPIALAVMDFANANGLIDERDLTARASIHRTEGSLYTAKRTWDFKLPLVATEFIDARDARSAVPRPFQFQVNAVARR